MKEALAMSLIGVVVGFAGVLIFTATTVFGSSIVWIAVTSISVVISGVAGALLSALRAASRDLIEAFAYE